MTAACRADVDRWSAHHQALALAKTGADPSHAGLCRASLAWLLAAQGPLLRTQVWQHLGRPMPAELDRLEYGQLREAMYPNRQVATVYRILFGIYTGIVPNGIGALGLEDVDWAGDTEVLLMYVKGRTAPESLHLPRRATQLLERWLVLSDPLRRFASAEQRTALWLWSTNHRVAGPAVATMPMSNYNNPAQDWAAARGLHDDHGEPFPIDSRRIRVT